MFDFWQEPFLRMGLMVGLITGALCTLIGLFVILKRVVFIGIAISQAAALGVTLGCIMGVNHYITSFIFSILTSMFFWMYSTEYDIPRDTIVALIYLVTAGLTTLLIATHPSVKTHGHNILSGNLLFVTSMDLMVSLVGGIFVVLLFLYFYRALVFVSYDRETAFTSGIEGDFLNFLFYLLLGTVISISMRVAGLLFVFASLVIPVMAGLKLFTSVNRIIICGIFVTAISVVLGFALSYNLDLPTSPLIICIYGVFFILALIIRKFGMAK